MAHMGISIKLYVQTSIVNINETHLTLTNLHLFIDGSYTFDEYPDGSAIAWPVTVPCLPFYGRIIRRLTNHLPKSRVVAIRHHTM